MMVDNKKRPTAEAANLKTQLNSNIKDKVLSILMESEDPITRMTIANLTHTSDRKVRHAIEQLRQEGYPVCSSSRIRGYWLGDSKDVAITVKEMRSRAMKLLRTADMISGQLEGQITFEEGLL